jgi:hypothetical protein
MPILPFSQPRYQTSGDEPSAVPKLDARSATRIPNLVAEIRQRHADRGIPMYTGVAAHGLDTPEEYSHAADVLEQHYGLLNGDAENPGVPSWRNAQELADSPEGEIPTATGNRSYTMHPARYNYMQDVGRDVDLLRGLAAKDPDRAIGFWDRSKGAKTTRHGTLADANYYRFAPNNFANAITNRNSLPAQILQNMELASNELQNWAGGGVIGAPTAGNALKKRTSSPTDENPIGMLGPETPGMSHADREAEFQNHADENAKLYEQLAPASGHHVATRAMQAIQPYVDMAFMPRDKNGKQMVRDPVADPVRATRFQGDAMGTAFSLIDPTALMGIAAKTPKLLAGLGRMAGRTAMSWPGSIARATGRGARAAVPDVASEMVTNPAIGYAADQEGWDSPAAWSSYFGDRVEAAPLVDPSTVNKAMRTVEEQVVPKTPMHDSLHPTKTPTTRYIRNWAEGH